MFNKTKIANYAQVLVVVPAFVVMVIASYIFTSDIERRHLQTKVKDAISYTESKIQADLLEPETMLASFSETVRSMILRGDDYETVWDYMLYMNNYMKKNEEKRLKGIIVFYGVFDVFNGRFIAGDAGWIPPAGFVPQNRPWYLKAVEADGDIGVTQPYTDVMTGDVAIAFTRRIYDEDGEALGVVSMDIRLDQITRLAIDTQFTKNGFGFLLSADMEVITHPESSMMGMPLHEVKSGIAVFEDEVREKGSVSERLARDFRGNESIIFIERLYNGWYMGIATPKNEYNQSIRKMAATLTTLSLALGLAVTFILLRIIWAKQKADLRTKVLYKTNLEKTREAKDSKRTIHILENILNSIDAMVHVTIPHSGEILFINNYTKKLYNLEGDCIGQPCYIVFMPGSGGICDFCPCFQLDKNPDGTVVWELRQPKINRIYRCANRYIEWYDGRTVMIQYCNDETELITAKNQAVQANEAKTNFLAKMSHEIRTPMNAVLGITEIQLQNQELPPEAEEAFGRIYNSGYMLLNIINDILDLSKIEAGKLELAPVNYDTASLINDTSQLNILRYDSKPIDFMLELDENIPITLFGDELRIKQILNNLLSNAFKYTDKGEIILSVSAEYVENSDGITLVFRVSDTGQGMTQEQVANLFDEYSRFNMEANRKTEGTGLGMNITKNLTRMMNGEISVESVQGKGSVFTVRLPQKISGEGVLGRDVVENLKRFQDGRTVQNKKAPQITREYMPYGKVLIVDDVETNLYVAKGLLAPYGLSIETALSGFETIEKIKNGAVYDVVFMDHYMPVMDGIEAAKVIRGLGYTRPVIAFTANALAGQAEMFMKNGFDGYLSKPIDIRQLNAALNRFVRDKHPAEAAEAARLKMNSMKKKPGGKPQPVDQKLVKIFTRDAEKAVGILEIINKKRDFVDEDIRLYTINVHAMKSALANIGEAEFSALAGNLEDAGRERDIAVISEKTPAFLAALHSVIEKNRIKENGDETAEAIHDDDRVYLSEKLNVIRKACTEYDNKSAKDALAQLRLKTWPHKISELLETIENHLLHSDFDKSAELADMVSKNY